MAVRIAKGTASSKTSGNTLTIPNVSLNSGSSLIVCAGYDDVNGHPTSVTWGQRSLKSRMSRDPVTYDIAMSIWSVGSVRDTATRDITITWSGNIVERAAVATAIEGANKIDSQAGKNETVATTNPTSGATTSMTETDNFVLAFFVGEAPDTNDISTLPEINLSGAWTAATFGQRIGTNGVPPTSNVTVQEVYHQLTDACAGTEVRMTNDTARLWVNAVIAMETLSIYQIYYASGKCSTCNDIVWCDNEVNSVVCSCSDGILHADGTFSGNIIAVSDQELKDAIRSEITDNQYDDIELVLL